MPPAVVGCSITRSRGSFNLYSSPDFDDFLEYKGTVFVGFSLTLPPETEWRRRLRVSLSNLTISGERLVLEGTRGYCSRIFIEYQ